jgi:mannose-6-phosphate isomerase-like protein (cupin superfamily)
MISRANASHYRWGGSCDGWRLVDGNSLSVIQEHMPPGTFEVRHAHQRAQQFFFVLDGILTIEFEHTTVELRASQGEHIPPGKVHQVRNDSDRDVEFLVISEPTAQGDRIEQTKGPQQ